MTARRAIVGRIAAAALVVAAELTAGLAVVLPSTGPAAAQGGFPFFPFFQRQPEREPRFRQGPGGPGGGGAAPPPVADFSRAPAPPRKPADAPAPTTTVTVLGDGFADWLAYGLEDAFGDTPEVGILRRHKTYSGLIRYESRRDAQEWPQVARQILGQDKPSFVVMMIGLGDRVPLREPAAAPARPGNQRGQQNQPAAPAQQQQDNPPAAADTNDEADPQEAQVAPVERARPGSGPSHEFRSERWAELYGKKIEDTITALKSAGVPVLWVGLPSIRGTKSTSDVIYLNNLFRSQAEKNGIVYIDIWDGFVDEGGRYALQGPDLEGQIRRLRSQDGVHFTKFGARKLAHYVEREIRRMMTVKVTPVALPMTPDPATQAPGAGPSRPSEPAARPLAGPVLPLNSTVSASDELLGGGNRQGGVDPLASRVLVKGESIAAPAGRADDFSWPRRAPSAAAPGPVTPSPPVAALDSGKSEPAAPAARTPGASAAVPPGAEPAPPRRRSAPAASRENAAPREGATSREAHRPPARARVTSQEQRRAPQQDPRAPRPPAAIPDSLIPFFRPVR